MSLSWYPRAAAACSEMHGGEVPDPRPAVAAHGPIPHKFVYMGSKKV